MCVHGFRYLPSVVDKCKLISPSKRHIFKQVRCYKVKMFRRSRFSIRPNVVTAGRTAAAPQEAPSTNQEASETPKDVSESSTTTTTTTTTPVVTDNKSVVTPSEKPAPPGDGTEQNGEGTSSSAAVQRRKRFSIKPKVAPGRPTTLARAPKSPVKAVSETPIEIHVSDLDKPTPPKLVHQTLTTAPPQRLLSPRRRRPSEESKQPKTQPKPIIPPSDSSEPSAVPTKDFLEQIHLPTDSGQELESNSGSQVEEVPSRLQNKVPPSLPDKEAIAISEKAKNLVSSKTGLTLSQPAFSLSRLLNDPSDLQRIAKAQKLRELLKQEMHKEKKIKRAKARVKEYTLDPAKMTMRDLIRYLPLSNPMTSSLEDATQENEMVVPTSPVREDSPARAQEPVVLPKIASPREEAEEEAEEEAAADAEEEEEQDDAIMVPQVKVAEDGTLIIDEESLTVEVQRAKGPNPAQDRDPIFERGSTTTYSSFRKGTYSKPWSSEETDMFFLAISMVGTDFSMICQLFPLRARSEIKNKFKKEERENAWRIDKAFRERRKLDIEYFSKLLEKILEVQKTRKKLKSLAVKKSPKKKENKKTKDKKASRKLSVVEEGDEEEQNEISDLEEEGEKENEDLGNEGGTTAAKPQKKRKRKNKQDASTKEPNDKKNKTSENEHDEAYIPGDTEAALPEDCLQSDTSEKTDGVNESKDNTIKPAKLSRGRAPKPLLPLGRKWGKKPPPPSTKTNDAASDKEDESEIDGASEEQVNKDPLPLKQASKTKSASDDISSGEEDVTVQLPRPTRYGRVPKPTKPLNYPGKEATHSSETPPASPAGSTAPARPKPKSTAKRGSSSKLQSAQESKKPKLVTLRASRSEYSDEEDENQREEEEVEEEHPECSSINDSTAPAFVPASLRSPHPVISEVEETMEELDILANMPDVLGISQDVLYPDAFCERAQNEIGTAETCEHQLDLLIDVIDYLSIENTEVSEDKSYNEAAQTLLTIGNMAHLSQNQDDKKGTTAVSVNETSQHLEEEMACCSKPAAHDENSATLMSATSVPGGPETVTTVELQNRTTDTDAIPVNKSSDQRPGSYMDPTPQMDLSQESSKTNSPQTRTGRLTKVKPKPNPGQSSRTVQSKSQPETSIERKPEESHTVAPDFFQATEILSGAEEIPKIADCSKNMLNVENSHIEVKHTEKPFGNQKRSVGHVKSGAAKSDQGASENHSHNLSEVQLEPNLGQATREFRSTSASTDEVLIAHVGTNESSCNNQVTSNSAVTESQIGQVSNIVSAPVQASIDYPASYVTPVEELPVSQKEDRQVASTSQTKKRLFQKVKPNLNLAQTSRAVRSKPQITKGIAEKDSSPTPKIMAKNQAEPTCITSPEKPTQSPCTASDLKQLLDLGTTFIPTEELSTSDAKKSDAGVVGQLESGATTSHQSASENPNLFKAHFEPSKKQATRDSTQTLESKDEKHMCHFGTTESSCNNPLTSDSGVTESQVGQGLNIISAPDQESRDHAAPCVTPVEELPVSQKEKSKVESTCQTTRGLLQKVKPVVSQTSRTVRSKAQTTKDPFTLLQLVEIRSSPTLSSESTDNTKAEVEVEQPCSPTPPEKPSQLKNSVSLLVSVPSLESCSTHKSTEELCSTEEQKIDVGCRQDSKSEGSEQNVPQRRRHFPKVKHRPNLGSCSRATFTKPLLKDVSKPSEQCHMDTSLTFEQQLEDKNNAQTELELTETDSQTSTHCSLHIESLSSTMLRPAESEKSIDSTTPSDNVVIATSWIAENQCVLTDSVLTQSSEKATVEVESTGDKTSNSVVVGPASHRDCKQGMSIRATNTQPTDDPAAVTAVHTSGDGLTESKIEFKPLTNTQSSSGPKITTQQPRSQNVSEPQSQDAVQHCSESNQTAAQRIDDNQSVPTDCPSRKAPQTCRGRLIKPKPNLGRSSRPPQLQQIQKTKQAETDFGTCSEDVDALFCHKLVSELQPDIQEPVEGAIEQCSNQNTSPSDAGSLLGLTQVIEQRSQHDPPPNVAGSSLGCVTQLLDRFTQDASTSSTGGTKSHPSLNTVFPDMLLQQKPFDADEPFFILSLTEIPVCSLGEAVDSVPESLPYLPVTDVSVEQQSVSGESLAAAGNGLLSNVAVFMEESGETGLINTIDIGPDPAPNIGLIMENPVDPHENNDGTEMPPAKQRLMETCKRRAKLQVKPNTTKRKQASKTLTAKEAESIPIHPKPTGYSGPPGPSVQPKVFDDDVTEPQKGSDDHLDGEKVTLRSGEDPEDSSSGAQTTKSRRASSRKRKAKGSLSLPSETNNPAPATNSPPGKEGPKGRKVKTPRAARKPSTPAPAVSTSYDVTPTFNPTQLTPDTHLTSSTTSPAQTEVDADQTCEHSPLCSDTTPSTSLCPAEVRKVSASQQSVESSSMEEEPNCVSQYFLSDIFTEVTAEKNDETEISPAAQTEMDTHRRAPAKLQVKPNTTKRKQASKTLTAKEAESIPIHPKPAGHSRLPGSSVQPKDVDDDVTEPQKGSDDHMDVEKETLTGGKDPEDSSSGAQTTRTRRASSRNRKTKGSLSLPSGMNNAAPASDSPPGKEVPKGRKVKTPRAARKPSTPAPAVSKSYDVTPTFSPTQLTQEAHSTSSTTSPTQTEVDADHTCEHSPLRSDTTPSTSLCPAEVRKVSASQQSVESSSMEEEPTCVSQYFLSDIFTEVTAEKNDETEIPPAPQTEMDTHRREPAKLQVKPNTTKRKQASKTLTAKEAESIPIHPKPTEYSRLLGPSVQPRDLDDDVTEPQKGSDDHMDVEKETLTGGKDPEDSGSGAQTTRTSSRNGKAKGSLSLPSETSNAAPVSNSPPGKEGPKGRKVKTPRAARKPSTPAPSVSTSFDVTPTFNPRQPTLEAHLTSSTTSPAQTEVDADQTCEHSPLCSDTTPSTSLCPAEVRRVSASQQSVESSSMEEEPTCVSQYFLSDIFTEVEEG
ncbi:transcription factor TFIIIB component B'' homolog isoform X2 [Etheostoma cragini]|uniref:transcription factor TFIIIB component B'' homolog isoform X2 n=1 Tax=Etheostoma cragini TaxID=417921 RepID=UPI00155E77B2|nr:transcription factor TFIIIB component B'' homolog isoform X2 [Etheostoma cragini]